MALKPRHKRRIFWTAICTVAIAALAIVFVPPMITLNYMKPKLESAIAQRTGINAQILGNIHFSLLGHATIVAHNVAAPMGKIDAAMFTVPLHDMFDISNAKLSGKIAIYGAHFDVSKIVPTEFNHDIQIYNSRIVFMDKDYDIIRGRLNHGQFNGTVRTDQHKYEIEYSNDEFLVRNQNNKLVITGQLYSNGTARGQMSIETRNINRWFDFTYPKITQNINLTMNFTWDGGYGFNFTDIRADNFTGNISLMPDGRKNIELQSDDINYDFSFLLDMPQILYDVNLNLDFSGRLKFANREFKHIKIDTRGATDHIQIDTIIADDTTITGGRIDKDGAHDILIGTPINGIPATCLFSGTKTNWQCSKFTYGHTSGNISVTPDEFYVFITSPDNMPAESALRDWATHFGNRGTINFKFNDAGGTLKIAGKKITPTFTFAKNKTLQWLNMDMNFIPASMMTERGNFEWDGNLVSFQPYSKTWRMSVYGGQFYIAGENFKVWMPDIDLQSVKDMPYIVSGDYNNGNISNLELQIAGHVFTGTIADKSITLRTETLNIDSFVNQDYIDNYEALEFLTVHPITLPFALPVNISLAADTLIYNGNEYKNFLYSLKSNTQTFSISDNARGNLLATITKNKSQYNISIQLNKFAINGELLSGDMPLNVRDTSITAEINLTTSGQIAHDIAYNIAGNFDMAFDGGYIMGLGIDEFYASAENITGLTVEYALAAALDGGETRIKKMHITGTYSHDNFATTQPITLSVRHADATGGIQITNGDMTAQFYIVMRGTAPTPAPIDFEITGGAVRNYSLSEIMRNFDAAFMRYFVKTHNRF